MSMKVILCSPSTQPQGGATVKTNIATDKPLYSQVLRSKIKICDATNILRNECLDRDPVKSTHHIDDSYSKKKCFGVMKKSDKCASSNNSSVLINERENVRVSNLNADEVTLISGSEASNFEFCPLMIQQQKKLKLNIF